MSLHEIVVRIAIVLVIALLALLAERLLRIIDRLACVTVLLPAFAKRFG
jgi:hypothetical protein